MLGISQGFTDSTDRIYIGPSHHGSMYELLHPSPTLSSFYCRVSSYSFTPIMAPFSGIDLLMPSVMVASFLSGLAAALGHHLFYQALHGTEAHQGTYTVIGISLTEQEANLAAGNALAFVVKASMVLTVAVAYTQLFWTFARTASREKGIKLSQLDSTASARSNIVALLNWPAFRKQPVLLLLALISW